VHNEELRGLYSSSSIINHVKEGDVGGACSANGYGLLVRKPSGRRPLRRPRRRWWITKDEPCRDRLGWCGVHCIGLTQDRYKWRALVNAIMNLQVP
jgi:hypothetical protein